jgi:hypothetical protein
MGNMRKETAVACLGNNSAFAEKNKETSVGRELF